MDKPLIAVVNDDTTFLELMNDLLSDEGYRTMLVKEGNKAYRQIREEKPDLVILDIRLEHPEMGWTILELIQLDPTTATIPVIVSTADSVALKAKADLLARQGIEALEKPFRIEELITKIDRQITKS